MVARFGWHFGPGSQYPPVNHFEDVKVNGAISSFVTRVPVRNVGWTGWDFLVGYRREWLFPSNFNTDINE